MGVVYEAHHVDLGRVVALKVLPKERCRSPELENRFRREARTSARLRHPNLVQLHDFGVSTDGRPYYAMELLEGETLDSYLERERGMDWREAARIGMEICTALEAAHAAALVHRDIKPGNVFLTREGKVKLLDFGVVQIEAEEKPVIREGEGDAVRLVGTAEYMAPEQAAGEALDERADLYAVGAVLYELVTGRLPHVAETTMALIDKKLRIIPESPRERAPGRGIPAGLDRAVMRALTRFPAQRYKTAVEMRTALDAALHAPERERTMRRRIAVAALVLTTGAVTFAAVKSCPNAPDVRMRAVNVLGPTLTPSSAFTQAPVPLPSRPSLHRRPRRTVRRLPSRPPSRTRPSPCSTTRRSRRTPAPQGVTAETLPATAVDAHDTRRGAATGRRRDRSDGHLRIDGRRSHAYRPEHHDARTRERARRGARERARPRRDAHEEGALPEGARHRIVTIGKTSSERRPRVLRGWSEAAAKTESLGRSPAKVAIRWASSDSSPDAQLYLAKLQRSAGQRYGAVATLTRLLEQHPEVKEAKDLLDRCEDRKLASR